MKTRPFARRLPTIMSLSLVALLLALVAGLARFQPLASRGLDPIDPEALTGDYNPSDILGEFHGQKFSAPAPVYATREDALKVLGDSNDSKRIEVDLTNQRLYTYENGQRIHNFLVSTGKWGRTPTGVYRIWGKFRYTKMSGGSRALHTYYYLPNVPFVMFFSNDQIAASRGFSLHGTYWHDNFGTPMSHGCVNMRTEEAEKVYYWSQPHPDGTNQTRATAEDPGTLIVIYGVTPAS